MEEVRKADRQRHRDKERYLEARVPPLNLEGLTKGWKALT